MNKNSDSKLALLTSIVLGALVLFLMFLCHRLILCISHVFVYLTGLATMLLVTIFYIFIILFLISRFQKYYCKYKKYKRNDLSNIKMIKYIIKIEKSLIFTLLSIIIFLYLINIFIY